VRERCLKGNRESKGKENGKRQRTERKQLQKEFWKTVLEIEPLAKIWICNID